MASFMAAYTGQTYALLRIVFGFTFLFHGTQKLLHFSDAPIRRGAGLRDLGGRHVGTGGRPAHHDRVHDQLGGVRVQRF